MRQVTGLDRGIGAGIGSRLVLAQQPQFPGSFAQIDRLINCNSIYPTEKLVIRVVSVEVLEGLQKRRLCCVGRVVRIAENTAGYVLYRPLVLSNKRFERLPVASSAALNERKIPAFDHNYTPAAKKLVNIFMRCG